MKFLIFILMFFILGFLLIISNNNLAMSGSENVKEFGELVGEWGDRLYFNLQSIVGKSVKLDWVPE